MPFTATNEVEIIMFSLKWFTMCFQPVLHFIKTDLKKPHMQFMQCQRTNVASPANKLHSNSRFLDSISRLVVPKNKWNNNIIHKTLYFTAGMRGTKQWQVLNYCLLIAKHSTFCRSLHGDFQSFLLFILGKLEIIKEITIAKKHFQNFIACGLFYFNSLYYDVYGQLIFSFIFII